ncbi:MAG: hypothetical protein J6X69_08495 [Bacteroidales bacterium]|nr:hypothetical protein [Bacteroidales bacterium]
MKNFDVDNWLETSGRKRPYKVSDGYFETFQEKMAAMARESAAEKESQRVPTLGVRLRPIVAMAASFVLLVALGGLLLKTVTPSRADYEDDDYYAYYCEIIPRSDTDAIYYSQAEEAELSEEEVVAYLSESEVGIEEFYTIIDEVQYN